MSFTTFSFDQFILFNVMAWFASFMQVLILCLWLFNTCLWMCCMSAPVWLMEVRSRCWGTCQPCPLFLSLLHRMGQLGSILTLVWDEAKAVLCVKSTTVRLASMFFQDIALLLFSNKQMRHLTALDANGSAEDSWVTSLTLKVSLHEKYL